MIRYVVDWDSVPAPSRLLRETFEHTLAAQMHQAFQGTREMVLAPPNEPAFRRVQEVLRLTPPDQFKLDRFWEKDSQRCAIGLAMRDPWFIQRGFTWAPVSNAHDGFDTVTPVYELNRGWQAVMAFFRISAENAGWIFDIGGYPSGASPANVIDHIDRFLEEHKSYAAS
jgi:hypothetical protein